MKNFYSCDWGTSSFRLRLINADHGNVLSAVQNDHGIAAAYELWKKTNGHEEDRIIFYQSYIFEQIKKIQGSSGHSAAVPIILSGMASSSIGMIELPYKKMPFNCDGSNLVVQTLKGYHETATPIMVISGVRSETDVMRGEETMLAGCQVTISHNEQLFIFPGTHSKHVRVYNGTAKNLATYMTGEMFDLLCSKSILSASIRQNNLEDAAGRKYFVEGVKKGATSNLLNSIFQVRTNQLFKKATPDENYHYLSGLLIGHELKDIPGDMPHAITLVCRKGLKDSYIEALNALELTSNFRFINADDALINGHCKIYAKLLST